MKVEKCPTCECEPYIAQEMKWKWHCYCLYWKTVKGKNTRIDHGIFYGKTKGQAIRRWNRWARREAKRIKEGANK